VMKWGVIGCGVIGRRRGEALPNGSKIVACYDVNESSAQSYAKDFEAKAYSSLEEFFSKGAPEVVIISTVNSALAPCVQACVNHGVACIVEKPAARSLSELKTIKNSRNVPVKVGFNHRFHPAFKDLLDLIRASADADPVMYIRGRYGNGARVGFDREWRANVEIAGGGELLDQGVHLIDLALQICPALEVSSALCKTQYWDMPVDDNSWALMSAPTGESFSMQVSSTEWKNEFQFDVYTRKTKYVWSGLGRSYGPEKLTIYRMKPEMGPPDVEELNYDGADLSWLKENENFEQAIISKDKAWGSLEDAAACLKRVEDIYQKSFQLQGKPADHPKWWQG